MVLQRIWRILVVCRINKIFFHRTGTNEFAAHDSTSEAPLAGA